MPTEFIFLMIAALIVGGLICYVPSVVLWRLTKRWPTWLRLAPIALVIALVITPVGVVGEGGGGILPALLVLFGSLTSGLQEDFLMAVMSVAVVAGILYVIMAVVVLIRRSVLKKSARKPAQLTTDH